MFFVYALLILSYGLEKFYEMQDRLLPLSIKIISLYVIFLIVSIIINSYINLFVLSKKHFVPSLNANIKYFSHDPSYQFCMSLYILQSREMLWNFYMVFPLECQTFVILIYRDLLRIYQNCITSVTFHFSSHTSLTYQINFLIHILWHK